MRAMPIRIALFLLPGLLAMQALAAPPLDQLTLPKGFHIALHSDQVVNARDHAGRGGHGVCWFRRRRQGVCAD